ncbi:MAG: hypothetical protein WA997_07840 [Anaerolineales bacterium]
MVLSIPSAINIFDSGRGSLEYTSVELQAERSRIKQTEININCLMCINPFSATLAAQWGDKQKCFCMFSLLAHYTFNYQSQFGKNRCGGSIKAIKFEVIHQYQHMVLSSLSKMVIFFSLDSSVLSVLLKNSKTSNFMTIKSPHPGGQVVINDVGQHQK